MDEHIFFQTERIVVTEQRVVISRKTYSLHDVKGAEKIIWKTDVPLTIPLILAGLGILFLFINSFPENLIICIMLLTLAFGYYYIYDKLFTKTYIGIVHYKIVGEEIIYAFKFKKNKLQESEAYLSEIVEAINSAIEYRGTLKSIKIEK
jgi:hypothetical protein